MVERLTADQQVLGSNPSAPSFVRRLSFNEIHQASLADILKLVVPLAQWIARSTSNAEVVGSSPTRDDFCIS